MKLGASQSIILVLQIQIILLQTYCDYCLNIQLDLVPEDILCSAVLFTVYLVYSIHHS